MKNFRFPLPAIAALLGLLTVSPVFGASKKKPSPPPLIKVPTISAVTANSITVTDAKVTKTLTITQFTEIIAERSTSDRRRTKAWHDGQLHLGHGPD